MSQFNKIWSSCQKYLKRLNLDQSLFKLRHFVTPPGHFFRQNEHLGRQSVIPLLSQLNKPKFNSNLSQPKITKAWLPSENIASIWIVFSSWATDILFFSMGKKIREQKIEMTQVIRGAVKYVYKSIYKMHGIFFMLGITPLISVYYYHAHTQSSQQ